MMMQKLRTYLWWKGRLSSKKQTCQPTVSLPASSSSSNRGYEVMSPGSGENEELSAALKKKDQERAQKALSRRRVRGGAPIVASRSNSARVVPPVTPNLGPSRDVQVGADEFVES